MWLPLLLDLGTAMQSVHSGPLLVNQDMVLTILCSHPGHIWQVQHKVE